MQFRDCELQQTTAQAQNYNLSPPTTSFVTSAVDSSHWNIGDKQKWYQWKLFRSLVFSPLILLDANDVNPEAIVCGSDELYNISKWEKPADVERKPLGVLWNVSFSERYEMFMGDAETHVHDGLDGVEAGLDFQSPLRPQLFSKWRDL